MMDGLVSDLIVLAVLLAVTFNDRARQAARETTLFAVSLFTLGRYPRNDR